jgi:fumarate hydratase subunit beta
VSDHAAPVRILAPLTNELIEGLRVGTRVLLSGIIYSARDAAHKRLVDTLANGGAIPIPLMGQVIYYVGPSPARPGEIIGSAGPTTSTRMDAYTLPLLARGLKGMIGKGSRNPAVREGIANHRAVYFVAVGGAAALIAQSIRRVDLIAYPDLGTEAIYQLTVEDFPLVVANDVYGGDLYEQGKQAYQRKGAVHEND